MKKSIVAAIIMAASFGASAGELCNAVGEVGEAAAAARDSGVPLTVAMAAVSNASASAQANEINKVTVEVAYKMANKSPKEVAEISRNVCLSTFGDN